MKKSIFLIALFAVSLIPRAIAIPPKSAVDIDVDIDVNTTQQTVEGWGSSLCWWAHMVGRWDDARIDTLIDLFTSPDKLNMNIFRYNIGGGDDPTHIGGHMTNGKGKRAEMEGFKAGINEPYHWDADAGQRNILLKIKAKRSDAIFEAFSNSPPYWMTISGCSAGNHNPYHDNLHPDNYDAFCTYLVDVCKHYSDRYGVTFRTLEPFNEPTSGYWKYMGSQEGCHFKPQSQIEVIRRLHPILLASALPTVISASDETSVADFNKVVKAYLKAGDVMDKVGQLNTHTYQATQKNRKEAHKLASLAGKPLWQSESGPMGLGEPAKGLKNNLLLTQKLFDDMRCMKPVAWIDWQLMEEHNDVWGLVRCNFETQWYEILKNFYVRMQVTRFIKQGYTIIETGSDKTLAAISPTGNEVVIVMLNTTESELPFAIKTIGFEPKTVTKYRTSNSENCLIISLNEPAQRETKYTAPPLSLTTFVFK
jgi:O-glycosyl hydrolase